MEFEKILDEEKGLLTLKLSGDISKEDIHKLTGVANEHTGKKLNCILDISGMKHIETEVAKDAVKFAMEKIADGFEGYCLVASGMFMFLISIAADAQFVREHVAKDISEAKYKLGY